MTFSRTGLRHKSVGALLATMPASDAAREVRLGIKKVRSMVKKLRPLYKRIAVKKAEMNLEMLWLNTYSTKRVNTSDHARSASSPSGAALRARRCVLWSRRFTPTNNVEILWDQFLLLRQTLEGEQ